MERFLFLIVLECENVDERRKMVRKKGIAETERFIINERNKGGDTSE